MESMRQQVLSGTLEKAAPDSGDRGVDMCSKMFGEEVSSPALNDTDEGDAAIPENSEDAGCYTESEWAGSEDSACSLESDASSNAISGNSLVSDADSAPSREETIVKKCPSGGSIVTYDEAVSKMNGDGECKAADDRQRRGKRFQTDAQFDEQDTSITAPRVAESAGKAWTDDKHCSYLNSIEATFVRSLYEQEFRVEMSEQDQDCVESRPMDPTYLTYHGGGELFTSLQRGCYDQREYYRPHYIFASSAPAVFASPWIQHFSPRMAPPPGVGGAAQDVFAGHAVSSSGFAEAAHCSNYKYQGMMESVPVLPDTEIAPQGWNNHIRFQSQNHASTAAPARPEASAQPKKRANLDPCADGMFRPKKFKSTQQKLAETDLELEEQFVLKHLKQKEEAKRIEIRESGCLLGDNNNPCRPLREEEHSQSGAQILLDTPPTPSSAANGKVIKSEELSAQDGRSISREQEQEQENDRNRRDSELRKVHSDGETPVDDPASCNDDGSARKGMVDRSGQPSSSEAASFQAQAQVCVVGESVVVEPQPAVTGARLKLSLDESLVKCHSDMRYDEHDECNFLAKRSPRACRTYTWGLMGTRRPLLSGNAKDIREDEALAKEQQQC